MESDLICPVCHLPLQSETMKTGEKINICSQCWGIWLAGNDLGLVGWPNGLPAAKQDLDSSHTCPTCQQSMVVHTYPMADGKLKIDQCPNCQGVWLDSKKEQLRLRDLAEGKKKASVVDSGPRIHYKRAGLWARIEERFFHVSQTEGFVELGGRLLLFMILMFWGYHFITAPLASNYVYESFWHNVNLPFHEAGHIIFSPFGQMMQALGGSLMQLLIPAICLLAFLRYQNSYGAAVVLWWFAESLMSIAPYINDARAQKLILLGGVTGKDVPGYHDWHYILRKMDWLRYDHTIAEITYNLGIGLMVLSLIWAGFLIYKQFGIVNAKMQKR